MMKRLQSPGSGQFLALAILVVVIFSAKTVNSAGLTEVTYPGFGKFTLKDFFHPTVRPVVLLPQSPEDVNPSFSLYTRENRERSEKKNYFEMLNSTSRVFKPDRESKFLIHGFIDNKVIGPWMREMKDNFLKAGDYNVFIVDWREANFFPYTLATANTRIIGPMIGNVIADLCKKHRISEDSFHIIGHSLGAHTAGYAGKHLNGKIGHITGLDPAGPYFEGHPDTRSRLWHTDAKFVDSIHTDRQLGMFDACSHWDFYPNGGNTQPGCNSERITSVLVDGLIEGARRFVACNHQRAVDFYNEAILENITTPIGYECKDYESFERGECHDCGPDGSRCAVIDPVPRRRQRDTETGRRFFMKTAPKEKFFRFQSLVTMRMARKANNESHNGIIRLRFLGRQGLKNRLLDFNKKEQTFRYGRDHSRVLVLDENPEEVNEVEFQWIRALGGAIGGAVNKVVPVDSFLSTSKLFIEKMEILPLSRPKQEVSNRGPRRNRLVFFPEIRNITNKQSVFFKRLLDGSNGNDRDQDRNREPNRNPDRDTNRDRNPSSNRDRDPAFGNDRDRNPSSNRDRDPAFGNDRDRNPSSNRDRDPAFGNDRDRNPIRNPSFGSNQDRNPIRDINRDRDQNRGPNIDPVQGGNQNTNRNRDRDQNRNRDRNRDRDRDQDRNRDGDRNRNRDRNVENSRSEFQPNNLNLNNNNNNNNGQFNREPIREASRTIIDPIG